MSRHAIYEVVEASPLTIRDVGPWGTRMSVTNDAEHVVEELWQNGAIQRGGGRLFYYDTEGTLDEILVSPDGRFAGFAPGPR